MRLLKGNKSHLPSGKHGSGNTKSSCLIELGTPEHLPTEFPEQFPVFLSHAKGIALTKSKTQNHKAHFRHQLHLAAMSKQPLKGTCGLRYLIMGFRRFLCSLVHHHHPQGSFWYCLGLDKLN